jgi:hypothetical protein
MSSRLLLTGTLAASATRRKRNSDRARFAVKKLMDTNRGERRLCTPFGNDPELIERLENMRVGEPLAVTGPFAITVHASRNGQEILYRITAEAILDAKRRKKAKGTTYAEERVASDEWDDAPRPADEERPFDDPLPF